MNGSAPTPRQGIKKRGFTLTAIHLMTAMVVIGLTHPLRAQESHDHPAPEKLGAVIFPTSCTSNVEADFERAVALLHSFAYSAARQAFTTIARSDGSCAMAHWGIAMSYYHQLWEPPGDADLESGMREMDEARSIGASSPREQDFLAAMAAYYTDWRHRPPAVRAQDYQIAMARVAEKNPADIEAQVFYALSLLAATPLSDRSHANQKRAADILEPILRERPEHPGVAHYLIHAYDSPELAARGLAVARRYAKIAPSVPHALHMPSHIFTRLGLWNDSIESNLAARAAAHAEGNISEELHAMDYLTYAYLQVGHDADAERVLADLRAMHNLPSDQFIVAYAATAIQVRVVVERRRWVAATTLEPLPESAPQAAAMTYWARAVAQARSGHPQAAGSEIRKLDGCRDKLQSAGNAYWAEQVAILGKEAGAWRWNAEGDSRQAEELMRQAADEEDDSEKSSVTPGPILPAREQLADLLLEHKRPADALREFRAVLAAAPGRRGAMTGAERAAAAPGSLAHP